MVGYGMSPLWVMLYQRWFMSVSAELRTSSLWLLNLDVGCGSATN